MDANALLRDIRDAISRYQATEYDVLTRRETLQSILDDLALAVTGMDDHLSNDGALPSVWQGGAAQQAVAHGEHCQEIGFSNGYRKAQLDMYAYMCSTHGFRPED